MIVSFHDYKRAVPYDSIRFIYQKYSLKNGWAPKILKTNPAIHVKAVAKIKAFEHIADVFELQLLSNNFHHSDAIYRLRYKNQVSDIPKKLMSIFPLLSACHNCNYLACQNPLMKFLKYCLRQNLLSNSPACHTICRRVPHHP